MLQILVALGEEESQAEGQTWGSCQSWSDLFQERPNHSAPGMRLAINIQL